MSQNKQHWQIADLPWAEFDASKISPDIIKVAKAAALVEFNGHDYAAYLCQVFPDDAELKQAAEAWAIEEVQHGEALGQWAMRADPSWDFKAAVARFKAGYQLPLSTDGSTRGSRAGELIARCIVETGTSSYYTALREASDEPVFKAICYHIAADELRHYKLFYTHLKRYLTIDKLSTLARLKIGLGRIQESEDDELAYAYYAANTPALNPPPYNREFYSAAYTRGAFSYYRAHHMERVVAMVFKACGLTPHSWLQRGVQKLAWWAMQRKIKSANDGAPKEAGVKQAGAKAA